VKQQIFFLLKIITHFLWISQKHYFIIGKFCLLFDKVLLGFIKKCLTSWTCTCFFLWSSFTYSHVTLSIAIDSKDLSAFFDKSAIFSTWSCFMSLWDLSLLKLLQSELLQSTTIECNATSPFFWGVTALLSFPFSLEAYCTLKSSLVWNSFSWKTSSLRSSLETLSGTEDLAAFLFFGWIVSCCTKALWETGHFITLFLIANVLTSNLDKWFWNIQKEIFFIVLSSVQQGTLKAIHLFWTDLNGQLSNELPQKGIYYCLQSIDCIEE